MSQICVYARFRPPMKHKIRYNKLEIESDRVKIAVGDEETEKFCGQQYIQHEFKFSSVFDSTISQQQIFDEVAVEMIDRFVDGFNGTVFAYGQTASGKTYTIEGSGRQYEERGLIPRTISYVYSILDKRREEEDITIHISFMEIYQNVGYDLLNPGNRNEGMMLTLPKVTVAESPNGDVLVKNLSSHLASNEDVALSLLFQGSTCRKVAETVMNVSSSRSHAVFTLTLTVHKPGSEIRTRSKLHLVDLAGSERVHKTGAIGQVLQEAKYINLSLHHLEHVIVVLHKQCTRGSSITPSSSSERGCSRTHSRGFVPYRNSLLTMVLRDSLGGNCVTAMIANLSPEEGNILETISTCRFAQRVACISNKARRNEELDDKVIIRKLKERIQELEEEVKLLKNDDRHCAVSKLNEKDKKLCHKILYDYLHGKIQDPASEGINNTAMFNECLSVLRDVVIHTIKHSKRQQKEKLSSQKPIVVKQIAQSVVSPPNEPLNTSSVRSHSTSPHSVFSSGFASLKDEEGTTISYSETSVSRQMKHGLLSSKQLKSQENPVVKQMHEQRQVLQENVNFLSLKVQEDNASTELHAIEGNLCKQRAQILKLEENGSLEELIRERMVEQQLKLKKTRLAEKLTEVQYKLKLMNISQPTSSTNKTPNDIVESTNESQKKIREDITDLKLTQLQKQLELKEAATRKRLISLKQQLQTPTRTADSEVSLNKPIKMTHSSTLQSSPPSFQLQKIDSQLKEQKIPTHNERETQYTAELNNHKTRIQQIRKCIKAAITIQRAWKKYKGLKS